MLECETLEELLSSLVLGGQPLEVSQVTTIFLMVHLLKEEVALQEVTENPVCEDPKGPGSSSSLRPCGFRGVQDFPHSQ